jgi:hypothetical protein
MKTYNEREWNYHLEVGDKVKICNDGPPNMIENMYSWKPLIRECIDKVGTVVSCWSDLHAFCCGSMYVAKVDFEGVIIDCSTQILIKVDE